MRFRSLPVATRIYLGLMALGGAASLLLLPRFEYPSDPVMVAALVVAAVLFSIWKVDLSGRQSQLTLTSAVVCLAALMQGGYAAVACAAAGALAGTLIRQTEGRRFPSFSWAWSGRSFDLSRPIFNAANCVLAAVLSTLAYEGVVLWIGSVYGPEGGNARAVLAAAAGSMVFQTVYFLINTLGVAGFLALQSRRAIHALWTDNFAWTWPSYLASAALAVGIHVASQQFRLGVVSVLFLAPAYWIYVSYRLYADRMQLMVARMEQEMRHMRDQETLNSAILSSLAAAIDAKDRHTRTHISRVQIYSMTLAERAGLTGPELEAVRIGALVHDIGKLGIPERILCKPGKLTPEEFRWMQAHVTIGAEILEPVPFPYPVKDIVLTHHERWDGLGYPKGLKENDIPIGGRIMAIADVFDALTSSRPYRKALPLEVALKLIQDGSRKQFDPYLVELFVEILPEANRQVEALLHSQGESAAEPEVSLSSAPAATLQERQERMQQEAAAAAELATALAATRTVSEVADVVSRQAMRLLPVDTAAVFLCRPDGTLRAETVRGEYEVKLAGLTMGRGEGVSGWVAETLQAKLNAQASLDIARRFTPDEAMELSAATAVPLVSSHVTLGVLTLYTAAYSVLNESHQRLLALLGEHATQALANALRFEETQELALVDPLTGLSNSRHLVQELETRCAQPGTRLTLAMLDLDEYQALSEALGHVDADALLQRLGMTLLTALAPGELACRYARDSFVLVMPETGVEQVQERVQQWSSLLEREGQAFLGQPLTLTWGWSLTEAGATEPAALLSGAERMLQQTRLHRCSLTPAA